MTSTMASTITSTSADRRLDSHAGKQDLTFIGQRGFTAEDQVRYFLEGAHTVVEVNVAGTSGAEMQIELDHHVSLIASDFIFAA